MSEYQYYEFQTMDRSLTEKECSIMHKISSRAIVSPTQAIFTYSYSDFRGDPEKLLTEYFDAMLYIANWGTRQLCFRFPKELINEEELKFYCVPHIISLKKCGKYIILDIQFDDEDGSGWIEGEGILSGMLHLRQDLLRGDYRVLYLAWLNAIRQDSPDEILLEPPVPDNLANLSDALKRFIEFSGIDEDLISAASENSQNNKVDQNVQEAQIPLLSEKEKIDFLTRLLKGELYLDVKFKNRLERLIKPNRKTVKILPRSIGELLVRSEELNQIKMKEIHQKKEKARIDRLKALSKNEKETWDAIGKLVRLKTRKSYEEAVKKLASLKELADYATTKNIFSKKVDDLCDEFHRYYSFIAMMRENKVIETGGAGQPVPKQRTASG